MPRVVETAANTAVQSGLAGHILNSATTKEGRPVLSVDELDDDCRVRYGRAEMTVKQAISQGLLQRNGETVVDPSAEDWRVRVGESKTIQSHMVPISDFLEPNTRSGLNAMGSLIGEKGVDALAASMITAAVQSEDPQKHGAEAAKVRNLCETSAREASARSGKRLSAGDVYGMMDEAMQSAQKGIDSYCEAQKIDGAELMEYLASCEPSFKIRFYLQVYHKNGADAVQRLVKAKAQNIKR